MNYSIRSKRKVQNVNFRRYRRNRRWDRSKNSRLPHLFFLYQMEQKQARRTPRFPCSASAEVIWNNSVELTRVTELRLYGCYLETARPLSRGTKVTLKIMDKGELFEATATVLYSQPNLGMGVAFREVKSFFQTVLEEWLRQSLERQNKTPSIDDFGSN